MRKMGKMCMVGMMVMVALTGCGKKEVAYDEATDTKEQEAVTESSSVLLEDMLGVGDATMWKENIEGVNGTIDIGATLVIPDTEHLYTLETEKYYVTAEDKKRIVEYFADADTIKVDKELVPTKESIQKEIESNDEFIPVIGDDVEQLAIYQYEQERLKGLLENARTPDEISEGPGDYSEDFYIGSKDGVDYTFSFYADESRNRSAWRVEGHIEGQGMYTNDMQTDQNNQCSMTKEEAEQKALKVCEELGLPPMAVVITYDLEWPPIVEEQDDEEQENVPWDVNGYVVRLARAVDGVAAEITKYFEDEKYVDGETTVLPYSTEYVEVTLTDDGILGAYYQGILTKGEMGEPVKVLSLEQIEEIYRKEMEKEDTGIESWQMLELTYMRVADENNSNKFRYIPAWKLYVGYERNRFMMETLGESVWINAMDGSRINIEEVGSAYYMNAQGMGDYE